MKNGIIALFFILISCVSHTVVTKQNYLTPRELNSNSSKYDGKTVLVRGYLLLGTNARSLFQSKERYDEYVKKWKENSSETELSKYDDDCLTLLNADLLFEKQNKLRNKTYTLRGVFEENYLDGTVVDLQACSKSALILEDAEVKRLIKSVD